MKPKYEVIIKDADFNVKVDVAKHVKVMVLSRLRCTFTGCIYREVCDGSRYNRETLEVTYKGKNIADVLNMTGRSDLFL